MIELDNSYNAYDPVHNSRLDHFRKYENRHLRTDDIDGAKPRAHGL